MRLCESHWTALRDRIKSSDVADMIARDGSEAVANVKADLEGKAASADPLMSANIAIWNNAMNVGGLAVMSVQADGSERCPICFLNEQHEHFCDVDGCTFSYDPWIDTAADEAIEHARSLRAPPSGDVHG